MVIKGSEGSFSCGIIRGLLLSKDEQDLKLVILVRVWKLKCQVVYETI